MSIARHVIGSVHRHMHRNVHTPVHRHVMGHATDGLVPPGGLMYNRNVRLCYNGQYSIIASVLL